MQNILLLTIVIFLSSCISVGNPAIKSPDIHSKIQKNISTKEDIQELFGTPQRKEPWHDNGEVWEYNYIKSSVKITGGEKNKVYTLKVTFNSENYVIAYSTIDSNVETESHRIFDRKVKSKDFKEEHY